MESAALADVTGGAIGAQRALVLSPTLGIAGGARGAGGGIYGALNADEYCIEERPLPHRPLLATAAAGRRLDSWWRRASSRHHGLDGLLA